MKGFSMINSGMLATKGNVHIIIYKHLKSEVHTVSFNAIKIEFKLDDELFFQKENWLKS